MRKYNYLSHASDYFVWICAGAPLIVFSFVPVNILRSEGRVKEAFLGSALGSAANMILDPIMIFGMGLGAGGAALATFLGYGLEALYYCWVMARRTQIVVRHPRCLKPNRGDLTEILRIGLPASVTNLAQSAAVMLTNRQLVSHGDTNIAAFGIASRAFMIAGMVLIGFSFGGLPIVGYSHGSGNRRRLRAIIRYEYRFVCGIALFFTVLLFLGAPIIMQLMRAPGDVLLNGAEMLR